VHGTAYNGERLGQGRDQAKMYLKDHPEVTEELRGKVLAAKGIGQLLMSTDNSDVEAEDEAVEMEDVAPSKAKGKKSKN
jgi:recombination protein RecA